MTHRARSVVVLFLTAAAACEGPTGINAGAGGGAGSTTGAGGGAGSTTGAGGHSGSSLPCGVRDVLAGHCQQCHAATPKFGAPMPLVTSDDLRAPANSDPSRKVYELVGERTHDDAHPMPQPPYPRLDAEDQKTLDDWIAAGAPSSTEGCGGSGGSGSGGSPPSCIPDIPLRPPSPYTMPAGEVDMYICYGIDVPVSSKRHITAILPHIDNDQILHHIVLFQSDTAAPPGPTPCGFGGTTSRLVAGWAPGNPGFELPPAAGLPIEGTAHYVLQLHYNNYNQLSGQKDASGIDLCTTDQLRPNDADVAAFGSVDFTIPAHGSLDLTCDYQAPASTVVYHAIGSAQHMHKLGKFISTVNLPGGTGAPVDLGTREMWDFNTQYFTAFDKVVNGGDVVRTRCVWDNNGNSDVHYGENTSDEMCFTFMLYYPKVTDPAWNWGFPVANSQCYPTP